MFQIQSDGPSHIHNVKLHDFFHNAHRKAAAIFWADDQMHQNGPESSVKRLKFNFNDPDEGYYMWDKNEREWYKRDFAMAIRDLDGSLTGQAGVTVMKTGTPFTEGEDCQLREPWNLQICQDHYMAVRRKREETFWND